MAVNPTLISFPSLSIWKESLYTSCKDLEKRVSRAAFSALVYIEKQSKIMGNRLFNFCNRFLIPVFISEVVFFIGLLLLSLDVIKNMALLVAVVVVVLSCYALMVAFSVVLVASSVLLTSSSVSSYLLPYAGKKALETAWNADRNEADLPYLVEFLEKCTERGRGIGTFQDKLREIYEAIAQDAPQDNPHWTQFAQLYNQLIPRPQRADPIIQIPGLLAFFGLQEMSQFSSEVWNYVQRAAQIDVDGGFLANVSPLVAVPSTTKRAKLDAEAIYRKAQEKKISYTYADFPEQIGQERINQESFTRLFQAIERRGVGQQRNQYLQDSFLSSYNELRLSLIVDVQQMLQRKGEREVVSSEYLQLYTILRYILSLSNERAELFSPREEALFALAASVQACVIGKKEGVAAYYNQLPAEYKKIGVEEVAETGAEAALEKFVDHTITQTISDQFSGETAFLKKMTSQSTISQLAHQSTFLKNLIGSSVGLTHTLQNDPHAGVLAPALKELLREPPQSAKKKMLKAFYESFTVSDALKAVQEEFQRRPVEEKRILTSTIEEKVNAYLSQENGIVETEIEEVQKAAKKDRGRVTPFTAIEQVTGVFGEIKRFLLSQPGDVEAQETGEEATTLIISHMRAVLPSGECEELLQSEYNDSTGEESYELTESGALRLLQALGYVKLP